MNLRAAVMIGTLFLGACSHAPSADGRNYKVSRDYEATSEVKGFRPYVYGNRTIIEFDSSPFSLSVKDEKGETVPYTKEGRYYRMDRVLGNFTVSTGLRTVEFYLTEHEAERLPPMKAEETPAETLTLAQPVTLDNQPVQEHVDLRAHEQKPVFILMKRQIAELRTIYQQARNNEKISGETLASLNSRLNGIEEKMHRGIAIIHVNFPKYGTKFKADDEVLEALLPAARTAERINVYGRTSSVIAGVNDPRIALERATNTRDYLVSRGVSAHRIQIASLPAGDFIAPASTRQGKAFNQRVAIEMIGTFY